MLTCNGNTLEYMNPQFKERYQYVLRGMMTTLSCVRFAMNPSMYTPEKLISLAYDYGAYWILYRDTSRNDRTCRSKILFGIRTRQLITEYLCIDINHTLRKMACSVLSKMRIDTQSYLLYGQELTI